MSIDRTQAGSSLGPFAITVLVHDEDAAQRLASALDDVRNLDGAVALVAVPPVRGLGFFADTARQPALDRWWAHAVPAQAVPVYVLFHETNVAAWIPGLDGCFIVAVANERDAAAYDGLHNVVLAAVSNLGELAAQVIHAFGVTGAFSAEAPRRAHRRLSRPARASAPRFRRARLSGSEELFRPTDALPPLRSIHPIPNLPPTDSASAGLAAGEALDPRPEDLVRVLAETVRRLERIRSTT